MDLSNIIAKKDEAAEYMTDEITHICKDFETRSPGTKGELQACEYMADVLKTQCGCEDVSIEEFKEHPGSFFGWIYITFTLIFIGIALFFVFPLASVILVTFGFVICFVQFGAYKKFVDFMFEEKTGHNVTAVKHCRGECKRRMFFNGHPDACWEWPVNYRLGGAAFEAHAVISALGALYYLVLSLMYIINYGISFSLISAGCPYFSAALWGFLFIPFMFGMFFMWNRHRIVDGANDNLTGCEMGIAILKQLRDSGTELENTEVGVIISGSEEAGLRGSKAWAEAHNGQYDDVPTFIISYDTIHDPKYLMVNYRDLNGTVKADKDVSDLFMEAAAQADVPCKKGWVPPLGGATDSAAFAQGGFRVAGVTGLNHKLESYYHTRKDSYDNLDKKGLSNCYAASVKALEMFDNGAKQ
jgi:hypothetical protein